MGFDRTKSIISVPRIDNDRIIGTLEGTVSVGAVISPTLSVAASATHNTGFGDSCLPMGIYSFDAGATWNDMGAQVPDLSGASPVFQTLDCVVSCSSVGIVTITCTNFLNPLTGSTPARTVLYKVVLLAKSDQGFITPLPVNLKLVHSSRFNYQKIHLDTTGSFTATAGNQGSLAVTHGLGYIPNVRVWRNSSGTIRPVVFQPEIKLTTTTLTFFYDAFFDFVDTTFNLIYRVYLDG